MFVIIPCAHHDLNRLARKIDALVNTRRHAHSSDEPLRVDRLVVVSCRNDKRDDQTRLFVVAKQRQVFGGSHLNSDRAKRIDDRRAQSHQRKRGRQLGLEDLFFALVACHAETSRQGG